MPLTDEMLQGAIHSAETGEPMPETQSEEVKTEVQEVKTEEIKTEEKGEANAVREEGKEKEEGKEAVETQGEKVEAEIKRSKREEFIERARQEQEGRSKETALKAELESERAKLQEQMSVFRDFQKDPIAYMERTDPTAYERWTKRHLGIEETQQATGKQDSQEVTALRGELADIKKLIQQNQETIKTQAGQEGYRNYMNQVDQIVRDPQYDAIREYAEVNEILNGEKIDLHGAAAGIWNSFQTMYSKELQPHELVELMLEQAEDNLTRFKQKFGSASQKSETESAQEKKVEEKKSTEGGNGSAQKTMTNEMESSSASASADDWFKDVVSKDDMIRKVLAIVEK